MKKLACSECDKSFDAAQVGYKPTEYLFRDIQCPECGVWLELDSDCDDDDAPECYYYWVIGKSEDQRLSRYEGSRI